MCGSGLAILGIVLLAAPVGATGPTVPGAPTVTGVTPGPRSVKVAFTKPADTGGSKITNYRAKCTSTNSGPAREHDGFKSPILVAGLRAGKTYTCTVAARNKVGLGAASAPSDPFVVLATVPGPPTITSVAPRVRGVKVTFTKPADTGSANITSYRVKCTSTDGGTAGARAASKSPIEVDGLSAGKTYTCTVAARNKIGLGPASASSDPVVTLGHGK
jgi:hypothetical protein